MSDVASGTHRWAVAIMGTLLQVCLGTVYAWSFFQKPLVEAYGWSNTQAALAFSLAICTLGLAAAWGGMNLPRVGPRRMATAGGVLFGLGYLVAALALWLRWLPLLYVGYGFIGGAGLGLGYVTPVVTAGRWFPDKKGLVTGMVVMGFGFGALVMSKALAPALVALTGGSLWAVFGLLGVILGGVSVVAARWLVNPPDGYAPPGYSAAAKAADAAHAAAPLTARQCLLSGRFLLMWVMFFCNIAAGISIISFQSPLMQDLCRRADGTLEPKALAAYGATLIAISSIFNGVGRFFWGGVSDRIGRAWTFRIMLTTQVAAFAALVNATSPWVFGALVCYVLLCYGGGFGAMPSFVLDVFGSRTLAAVVYGVILTAWSAAGVVGPLVVGVFKDHYAVHAARYSFIAGGAMLLAGLLISLVLSDKRLQARK